MEDRRRERALNQIVTLKRMAEDERTPEHERQSARDTMAKLRAKYDIPESTPDPATPRATTNASDFFTWFNQEAQRVKREQNAARVREQNAARVREREAAARKREAERQRAQRAWNERHMYTDAMGQPLSPEDLAEARRDPLAWAAKQDKRTHSQKQQDLNNAWGNQQRPSYGPLPKKCNPVATFFDQGGEARRRNGAMVKCAKCGTTLSTGQGGWDAEVGEFVCTEKVPGPRKKKSEQE